MIAIASTSGHFAVSLQPTEHAGPAVEENAAAVGLEHVARVRAAGVRPGGRRADDGQAHRGILPMCRDDSSSDRKARSGRPRSGREDHRESLAGRRDGGHLHGSPPDAGADRRDRDPGGRGRRGRLDPVRRAHDARAADRRRAARERRRRRARGRRAERSRRTTPTSSRRLAWRRCSGRERRRARSWTSCAARSRREVGGRDRLLRRATEVG